VPPERFAGLSFRAPRVQRGRIERAVSWVVGFGNVQLNVRPGMLEEARLGHGFRVGDHLSATARTFDAAPERHGVAVEDSSGSIAIAINRCSAADMLTFGRAKPSFCTDRPSQRFLPGAARTGVRRSLSVRVGVDPGNPTPLEARRARNRSLGRWWSFRREGEAAAPLRSIMRIRNESKEATLPHLGKRFRNRALATAAAASLAAGLFTGLAPTASLASSHREAPLTSANPQTDGTDLWAFVSPDARKKVTLISSWIPFEEPAGGPNFYPWGENVNYDINIDNDGDAQADITYRWTFENHGNPNTFLYNNGPVTSLKDPNLTFYQTYDLKKYSSAGGVNTLVHDAVVVPSNVGKGSMPGYNSHLFDAGTTKAGKESLSWVGQSDDPFFLDLRVFDLLYGGNLSEVGDDTLEGFNVNTMSLQVPMRSVARGHHRQKNPIIGVWTTASRRSMVITENNGNQDFQGPFVQVSRLGNPLVNEVVIPRGKKDLFNASAPKNDGQFLKYVYDDPELPEVMHAVYPSLGPVPDSNNNKNGIQRDDLVQVYLTGISGLNQPKNVTPSEELRLNMSIPPCPATSCNAYSRLGVVGGDVAGFPNGRRLRDDIVDASLQVVYGELIGNPNDLGDGVNANDVPFLKHFPYVAYPHAGSEADPH
jgi:hypothetical protein